MNQSETNDSKNLATEMAWEKLQKQLATEPVNAHWARWSKQANALDTNQTAELTQNEPSAPLNDITHESQEIKLHTTAMETPKSTPSFSWVKRNRKWLTGTAAASVLAITLFTSVGNQALASILNNFRMEQVTVVQEDDVRQIMTNVFMSGGSEEAINKFGTFSHTSGTINGEYELAEAEKFLNYKLLMPNGVNASKIFISPSGEITLKLHVDEVNKALLRLGTKKLLPQSIDGKPVKLIFGESVSVNKQVLINGNEKNYSFTQMAAPSVEVDPSIPVAEAIEAVLQFPFLPDYIKNNLKNSGVLNNGNIPLPIIANGTVEKRTIEGVQVVMTQREYKVQSSNSDTVQQQIYYEITWIKDSRLYNIGGDGFTNPEEAFALAKELIVQ